jgi:hypothetical protein
MGLMLGRCKERERKPRWARLAGLRVSAHGGRRARTMKKKEWFFFPEAIFLCFFVQISVKFGTNGIKLLESK